MQNNRKKPFNSKFLFLVLPVLVLFILTGCTLTQPTVNTQQTDTPEDVMTDEEKSADILEGHIGCQEGEISIDGTCFPAKYNNASLFGQDLDKYVNSENISNNALGFLAQPKETGNYPGVVMIHEWWGLNDNIKEMAKLLAKEGYIVFAVDLYGEVAEDFDKARELATRTRSNPEQAIADMKAATQYLKDNHAVSKLGSIGWCFGGQHSLLLSLNEPLDTTVIYYGQLISDTEDLKQIAGPVLGIFGSEDTSISVESVKNFEAGLNNLGIKNDINIYNGVGHAFANPSGSSYAKNETIDAWNKTVDFFNANLKADNGEAMMDPSTSSGQGDDAMMEEDTKVEEDTTMEEVNQVTFQLTGENFKFLLNGTEAPELRVKVGDKVRIEFTSTSGFHDWVVDEFDAATEQVSTGDSTSVEFTADQAGIFEYYCNVGNHRAQGMFGKLIVE